MMEEFKAQLLSIWIAFTEFVIRFFNNRSIRIDEQVSYLRLQLEKEKELNNQLIETIKSIVIGNSGNDEQNQNQQTEQTPIGYKKPWHVVRRELEEKSRQEALRLDREARTAIEREKAKNKSVETLEEELLTGVE